jgi:methylenetetrahydrofolate dehydrogenase (NADP+)/methenyltetrahydrofolate cyclohydrolase
MAAIIDGSAAATQTKDELKQRISDLASHGIVPGLCVILVGNNPASHVYVKNKEKACQNMNIYSQVLRMPEESSEAEIVNKVEELNRNPKIHGFLVQLPLPSHVNTQRVMNTILPAKDVDGFHPINLGHLLMGEAGPVPCTPAGIIHLIKTTGVTIAGKEAVVIGRSNIVGKPLALLLLRENATVTVCHSHTQNLAAVAQRADILVAAIGKARMIKRSFVKPGAVVIDVGINKDENNKLCGDVDFTDVSEVAGYLTPVPGGVGPMTIAMLLRNTVEAARAQLL